MKAVTSLCVSRVRKYCQKHWVLPGLELDLQVISGEDIEGNRANHLELSGLEYPRCVTINVLADLCIPGRSRVVIVETRLAYPT